MQSLIEHNQAEYAFDMAQEVLEKMEHANSLHELIPEESVKDLKCVDVTGRKYGVVKRLLDVMFSFVGLLMLLIPFLLIAAVIYIDDPGKILFSQYRVGRFGRRFKLYKFRTMRMDTPKYLPTVEMKDPDQHVTRVGRLLRNTSLDELPQLINVLKGDMSLVGPRPLISDEYEIHQMRMRFGVYNIRPGVTGLAQINGRDTVSPAEKVHWDVRYLQEFGMLTDIRILLGTISKVPSGQGVVEGYSAEENDVETKASES